MADFKKIMIQQEVFDLYDDYAHDRINRRQFVDKLSTYAIGGLTVPALLKYILPNYQQNIQVAQEDPRLVTETISFNSSLGGGEIHGQLSKPIEIKDKLPGIVVVHENRGLNPHIADVGRRAALAGFISIAPDALSPLGGYPGNDEDGKALQKTRDRKKMLEDFIAAHNYLKNHPDCTGRVAVVGFCFGGWVSNMMAARVPDLAAAVPFYGGQAPVDLVPDIQAPLLLHFAEFDKRVNAGWPEYEEALKEHKKEYVAHFYPGTNHGFHNDSTPRYNEEAANLAWQRTIDYFNEKLT